MFQSATLKLTGWYLLILMSISFIFSVAIYNITSNELGARLEKFQSRLERAGLPTAPLDDDQHDPRYTAFRNDQSNQADTNLLFSLIYVNLMIFLAGGAGSYFLAKRTLSDIEEAHELQSRFTSDASHELRTPLAVMKSEIEVALRDTSAKKSDYKEILESNLEEVNKLSRLSQMLLQLSKADNTEMDMEKVNIDTIITDVIKRQNQPESRIEYRRLSNDVNVYGNIASIEELCMILLDNAIKYSPDTSLVSIKLTHRNSKVNLEITNTGKGIKPEDLPHIFDRFYRADTSRTGGEKSGYGLGLALAKKIVELHNGELAASSAENHATTFSVLLPLFSKNQADSQH